MRNRKSNGLPIPYGEQLGHPQDCGCGCQLTPQQWQAEYENELALTPDGMFCMFCWGDDCGGGCYG